TSPRRSRSGAADPGPVDPSSLAPDFASVALVTIDTQRDTLDGQPFEVPGTSAALPEMRRLAAAFRAAGRPIVHVVRLYRPDGSNVDLCRRRAVADGARLVLVEDAVSGLYERGKDELRGIGVALMNAAELTASLLSSPAHAS